MAADNTVLAYILQGRIVDFDADKASHKVCYDDDAEEWIVLADERFNWLSPRGISAGGSAELQVQSVLHRCLGPGLASTHVNGWPQTCFLKNGFSCQRNASHT